MATKKTTSKAAAPARKPAGKAPAAKTPGAKRTGAKAAPLDDDPVVLRANIYTALEQASVGLMQICEQVGGNAAHIDTMTAGTPQADALKNFKHQVDLLVDALGHRI